MCVMCRLCLATSKQPPCQSINALFSSPLTLFHRSSSSKDGTGQVTYLAGGGAGPGPTGNPATAVKGTSKKEGRALTAGWSIYLVRDIIPSGPPISCGFRVNRDEPKHSRRKRHTAQPATGDGTCWLARMICAGPSCVGMGNRTAFKKDSTFLLHRRLEPLCSSVFYSRFAGAATRLFLFRRRGHLLSRVCRSRNSKKERHDKR